MPCWHSTGHLLTAGLADYKNSMATQYILLVILTSGHLCLHTGQPALKKLTSDVYMRYSVCAGLSGPLVLTLVAESVSLKHEAVILAHCWTLQF